jgi:hypothetical protein
MYSSLTPVDERRLHLGRNITDRVFILVSSQFSLFECNGV